MKVPTMKHPNSRVETKSLFISGFLAAMTITAWGFAPTHKAHLRDPAKVLPYKNWGLINHQDRSHIHALDAWKLEEGNRNILVAVIDTGIDADHPDLKGNIWQDPKAKVLQGRKPMASVRKGKNSNPAPKTAEVRERVYGWNFVVDQANPKDDHGHGTHVAGIIGAIANPKSGVAGVAQKVSIMAVKYYSDANPGSVNLRNTVRAINYAVDMGARIINYSGGGPEFSEEEFQAIKRAEARGVLFVAAAGNEHQDTDQVENFYYPSAYRLSNILSVAATDIHNNLLKSSNWGKNKVDVTAPGENIFSTLPGNRFGYMTGTSQATAFVTGVAALLLAKDPTLTPVQIKQLIMGSVDKFPQLADKVFTGGRVNAYGALLALKNRPKGASPVLATGPKQRETAKELATQTW
ncbi:MAG: S8 family serine peptidase [Bdellovibrionales bacterium]|nr:S8 family serine peptidase [Bdellovibrionales bacterium]